MSLQHGDAVKLVRKPGGNAGRVVQVGACEYDLCKFGDDCVAVMWQAHSSPTNHRADELIAS